MTTTQEETGAVSTANALKMAIEALECIDEDLVQPTYYLLVKDAIPACKEALEQPTQEPVAWLQEYENENGDIYHTVTDERIGINDISVYTHPAPSWQGLSNDEIDIIMDGDICQSYYEMLGYARAIEQALRERNCNDTK
ncbi:MAG: hypothetical protein ACR2IJ_10520 [Fluviibacter sp.]